MKAMLLAAGRGERMRMLSTLRPKPLTPVAGKPLIQWHLERLVAAGFREAVVNISHLGEQLAEFLGDGSRFGLRVRLSREAEPLETAGGIAQALPLLGALPFLLVNADIYCEFDYSGLQRVALASRLAHLVLVPNPAHHAGGDFSLRGGAVGNDAAERYTYAGIAVIAPALVAGVPPGTKAPLGPLLRAAAADGRLGGELYAGRWQDVGTPERLAALENMLASDHGHR